MPNTINVYGLSIELVEEEGLITARCESFEMHNPVVTLDDVEEQLKEWIRFLAEAGDERAKEVIKQHDDSSTGAN